MVVRFPRVATELTPGIVETVELRPTTSADLAAMHGVFLAAIGELYRRHAFTPPGPPPGAFAAQHAHLLEYDGERCWVADRDGEVVAYAAAFVRGNTWFLCSLFVHPDVQAQALGTRLLEHVWSDGVARRLTLTDAIQPVSNALYARRGLIPATPVLPFAGEPRIEPAEDLEPAEPEAEALRGLDLAAYGFDRAVDHGMWRRVAEATLWLRRDEPIAYSYAWPQGRLGPVAGLDAEAAGAAVRAELARRPGTPTQVFAPGSAAPVVEAALAAGLRIAGPPGLMLLSRPHRPPDALAIGSYTLL
jgi:GNAT superfamily N-acetyltransferase